jgi:5-methyltetrahydrofolate--homocysteine methyltransferase
MNYELYSSLYGEYIVLIIGERLNSSIKKVYSAIETKDTNFINVEAKQQVQSGAHVIDLNAGALIKSEPEDLIWMIKTVHEVLEPNVRIAIDSVNPQAIAGALDVLTELGRISPKNPESKPIINSVTAEKDKLEVVLPLVKKYNAQLVGMCMGAHGIPEEPEQRCELGSEILQAAAKEQIPAGDIYLDALVLPISTDAKKGVVALETIKLLKELDSDVQTIIGLSNISYGLPVKPLLNQSFIVMAMTVGLDAALLNPMDTRLMAMIKAAEAILGNDDFCMKYIKAYRNGELEL